MRPGRIGITGPADRRLAAPAVAANPLQDIQFHLTWKVSTTVTYAHRAREYLMKNKRL